MTGDSFGSSYFNGARTALPLWQIQRVAALKGRTQLRQPRPAACISMAIPQATLLLTLGQVLDGSVSATGQCESSADTPRDPLLTMRLATPLYGRSIEAVITALLPCVATGQARATSKIEMGQTELAQIRLAGFPYCGEGRRGRLRDAPAERLSEVLHGGGYYGEGMSWHTFYLGGNDCRQR